MKRFSFAAIGFLFAASMFMSCVFKKPDTQIRTVTVTGSGQIELESDRASIVLSVQTRNYDVSAAVQENADRMTKVQDALTAAGVGKTDISTQNYSIYQESTYQNGRSIPGQYVVSNEIQVTVREIAKAGSLIDTAVKAGANSLSSLTFSSSNRDEAVKQARILAVKQAEETATLLASTSGSALGKVITITENSGSSYPRAALMAQKNMVASDASTPVAAGKSMVSVTLTATFELQ